MLRYIEARARGSPNERKSEQETDPKQLIESVQQQKHDVYRGNFFDIDRLFVMLDSFFALLERIVRFWVIVFLSFVAFAPNLRFRSTV
jgi:hypothetical protein